MVQINAWTKLRLKSHTGFVINVIYVWNSTTFIENVYTYNYILWCLHFDMISWHIIIWNCMKWGGSKGSFLVVLKHILFGLTCCSVQHFTTIFILFKITSLYSSLLPLSSLNPAELDANTKEIDSDIERFKSHINKKR